jgi:putative transposase
MNNTLSIYRGLCFPRDFISHTVFLYHRFALSLRDIEELLALRGITVSYESIRCWSRQFGPEFARKLRRQQGTLAGHWLPDEVFVNIQGQRHYLWRAIDQNGDLIDILLPRRRNVRAAKRFFRKLLKGQQRSPNRLVTDKLGSYRVAHREEMPGVAHDTTVGSRAGAVTH